MIKRTPLEILKFLTDKGLPEDFCPVPFSTTLFEADGKVCLCRQKGNQFAIGDIKKNSFQDIWNGPEIRAIRKEFLTGKIKTCANEIRRNQCNLSVDRSYLLDVIDYEEYQKNPPIKISPNFNGQCNLECPMCLVWKQPNGVYNQSDFWLNLEKNIIPNLHEIDSFSGEPFLQKDTFRLINLAFQINPSISWSFTTNGNWILNDYLKNYLNKIKIKNFNFSIDSFDEKTYSLIRKNGNLSKALRAFEDTQVYEKERLSKNLTGLGLNINFVLQKKNWSELPRLFQFKREKRVTVWLICLVEPSEFSILSFSNFEKLSILYYYLEKIDLIDFPLVARAVKPLLETIDPFDKANFLLEYSKKLSQHKAAFHSASERDYFLDTSGADSV